MTWFPPILHVILYRSTATSPVSSADLGDILAAAARRNTLWGIFSVLLQGSRPDERSGVVQRLDSEWEEIESLFAHICTDARHTDIAQLSDGLALARRGLRAARPAPCRSSVCPRRPRRPWLPFEPMG